MLLRTSTRYQASQSPTYLAALAYEYRYVCVRLEGDPWILVNRRRAGIHSPLRLLQDARVLTWVISDSKGIGKISAAYQPTCFVSQRQAHFLPVFAFSILPRKSLEYRSLSINSIRIYEILRNSRKNIPEMLTNF